MEEKLTDDDILISKMIGVLMVVSKVEKSAIANSLNVDLGAGALAASKDYQMMIKAVWRLFPAGELEKSAVKFAEKLGFKIEQHHLQSGVEH